MNLDDALIQCPYCGEGLYIAIDPSNGLKQNFEEDCHVCCRPIQIKLRIRRMGKYEIIVKSEDE